MKVNLGGHLIQREIRQAITFTIACLSSLLVLTIAGLYPAHAKKIQLKRRIEMVKEANKVQQLLQPFITELMSVEKALKLSQNLAVVEEKPLQREALLKLDKRIAEMAEQFNLKATSVVINVDEIKGSNLVGVDALLAGDFMDFRRFLLKLGQIPWVHSFDSVEISSLPDREKMKLTFKLALE